MVWNLDPDPKNLKTTKPPEQQLCPLKPFVKVLTEERRIPTPTDVMIALWSTSQWSSKNISQRTNPRKNGK